MHAEFIEQSIRFHLHGIMAPVENGCYGDVGLRLMDQMWRAVKEARLSTTGINHWVYLSGGRMFVGVELTEVVSATPPAALDPLEFVLQRHLRYLHVGPYQALPRKWKELEALLTARGEVMSLPSLEIYGHHSDEPSQLETTIVIGLESRST
ncbi:MAG: hypothetical protein C0478_18320 [Planctomyces sp.]|nr:hypothetical protein [Planctomyces sp.]